MERFRAKVLLEERTLFDRVLGHFDERGGSASRSGRLEVHEGGLVCFPRGPVYGLVLDDGRFGLIDIERVCPNFASGIALMEFGVLGALTMPSSRPSCPGAVEAVTRWPGTRDARPMRTRSASSLIRISASSPAMGATRWKLT
jgi:hypothetical protein